MEYAIAMTTNDESIEPYCTAADIERLTAGGVTLKTLNNWAARLQWANPLMAPEKGRPRHFSRMNAIEAVIAHELMSLGLRREDITDYFRERVWENNRAATGWVRLSGKELVDLLAGIEALPEFHVGSTGWYWVLPPPTTTDPCWPLAAANGAEELAAALTTAPTVAVAVLDVSQIVARVDALKSEGAAAGG